MNNLQFGEFTLDRKLRELRRGDSVVSIPGKAFDLLSYMAANAGRPLTKAELLDAVWPETTVEESNLSQNVFLLRKVLGSAEGGPIKTLPGRGYQFAAEVTWLDEIPGPGTHRSAASSISSLTMEATETRVVVHERVEEQGLHLSRRSLWIAGSAVAIVVLAALGWIGRQRWLDRSGGAPVQVVLTPLEGTTGDAVLDKSLGQALRMDLAQSPYVSLVSNSTIAATLTQMKDKPDENLTPAIAREVCERTNSQSVLSGNIARSGQHYLITGEASSCVDGSAVAAAKYEVKNAEDLPRGIDKVAADLRQQLGESRRSIARFDTPLIPTSTASLDALKAYSQASALSAKGNCPDAIKLDKQALALDPEFPAARFDLAACYFSDEDYVNARPAIVSAYQVRDKATEPIRLAITSLYDTDVTQDLFAAEQNYRVWTELYPRSPQAWNGLYNVQRDLGHHADAVASGLRAIALVPNIQGLYSNVAYEQMRMGDVMGSRTTLDTAETRHLDGDRIRVLYIDIASLQNDQGLMQAQQTWLDAHPDSPFCWLIKTNMAIGQGRFADAQEALAHAVTIFHRQGLDGTANLATKNASVNLFEAGDNQDAARLFRSVPIDPKDGDDLVALAYTGDHEAAISDLQAMRAEYPQGTEWQHWFGPWIEGLIAMENHNPQQAIAILESARPFDDRDLDVPKLRADAYLRSGQFAVAEKEYRAIIARRRIDIELSAYPLSWLGLGEALAGEGKKQEAADAYQHFLTLWAHADANAMYLLKARAELAQLH